jgi:hypothetical protein
MGVLSNLGRFVENVFEFLFNYLEAIIEFAIEAIGFIIDLVDIIGWLNEIIETIKIIESIFFPEGGTDHVVSGPAFKRFMEQNQQTGNFTEVDLNTLNNSIIHVVEDNKTKTVVADQMIKSRDGFGDATKQQFQGKNELRIKIPVS